MSLVSSLGDIDFGKLADHTKTTEFEERVIPEGLHPARVVCYVELGQQVKKGSAVHKTKDTVQNQVWIALELIGKRVEYEITVDGVTKMARPIVSGTFNLSTNGRSSFKKVFDVIRDGDEKISHGAQLLTKPCLVRIKHVKELDKEGNATGKVRSNWREGENAVPMVQPSVHENPETGEIRRINPPAAYEESLKLLVWGSPSKEQWDSLFIAGTRTVKEGDKEKEVSKNWIQERILSAKNFKGSALHDLLTGVGGLDFGFTAEDVGGPGEDDLLGLPDDTSEPAKPAQPPVQPRSADPAPKPSPTTAEDEVADVLATLGMD